VLLKEESQKQKVRLIELVTLIIDEEPVVVDAFDLAEPVDIRKNLPPEFHEWVGSTKWKERKDALDALLTNAKVPRIKEENYSDIMGILAKAMKDANIVVVTAAAQCVEAIARGLRRPFGHYRQMVMQPMVEKLKERKPAVVEALSNAMDGVFTAVRVPYDLFL
jgi:cytoskeleton-associated protein 5